LRSNLDYIFSDRIAAEQILDYAKIIVKAVAKLKDPTGKVLACVEVSCPNDENTTTDEQ